MKGKMQAAILCEYNTPLKLEEVDIPQIGPDEALVRIRSCGVCHTDLHIIEGLGKNLPHALGHEGAGDVVEVGEDVKDVKVGDRVTIFLRFVCGDCLYCRTGRDNMCLNMKGQFGFNVDGAYADYAKVPVRALFKLPDSVSYDEGGIMADCVATVYRSVVGKGEVRPTDNVMIQGLGGLGLTGVLISKMVGARVIAVARTRARLEFAKQLGADETIDASRENVPDEVKRLTSNTGTDYVVNLVGTAEGFETALKCLGKGGKILQLGHLNDDLPWKITWEDLRWEKDILGCRNSTRKDLLDVINLVKIGKLKVGQIITDEFPLSQINHARDLQQKGRIFGRAVIKM